MTRMGRGLAGGRHGEGGGPNIGQGGRAGVDQSFFIESFCVEKAKIQKLACSHNKTAYFFGSLLLSF